MHGRQQSVSNYFTTIPRVLPLRSREALFDYKPTQGLVHYDAKGDLYHAKNAFSFGALYGKIRFQSQNRGGHDAGKQLLLHHL
ncbi:hypothetical protein Elgi_72920 [Paenibacillus elgii]|uniref:hypothetical protein n=1 Tax=Paenibacillus elgii TaxID=189691 RepID=UPI002D7CE647|nr:hypothetical protein Elgi_72920 [Paenibacillus elgii]